MKQFTIGWYKTFQSLSLDVVIGVIIFSLAIGRYYNVQIPSILLSCLSIAIWVIYTCDHLLDARKISQKASTNRHQFHQKYQKPLIIVTFMLSIVGIISTYYLPAVVFYIGLIVVLFTFTYFLLLQKTSFWAKEIYVAIIYTLGIFIGPIYFSYHHLQPIQWLLIPQVFLLVFSNLLVFSWFDLLKDKQDGHPSMVIYWGVNRAEKTIKFILIIGVIFSLTAIFLNLNESTFVIQVILLLMYGLLILIFKQDQLFRTNDLYRVIGDGIFFIPLFFLVYAELRQL